MSELRVGFIGAGRISDLHALAYAAGSRASLVAVCDADADLARARARQWGCERWTTDHRDLLDDASIDAVEILLPHHLHAEVAISALEAGKHVSVQKPMARTLAECEAMVAAAARSPGSLRVFENFRHYPPFRLARQLLDEGAIGEPQVQQLTVINGGGSGWEIPRQAWRWRFDPALCGGGPCMFDHGWHMFSLAMYLFGPVAEVHAWILETPYPRVTIDSPAVVSWQHRAPGRLGTWATAGSERLHVTSKYYAGDERVQLIGSEGVLWVNRCSGQLTSEAPLVLYRAGRTTEYHDLESDWAASFREGGRAWHRQLLDGEPPLLPLDEALAVQRFCEGAHESARSGQRVVLEP